MQNGGDRVYKVITTHLDGRQIDGKMKFFTASQGALPHSDLGCGRSEHPRANGSDIASLFCERNELDRRDQPTDAMVPTEERFDTNKASDRAQHQRLVVKLEFVSLHGKADVGGEFSPLTHDLIHAGCIG